MLYVNTTQKTTSLYVEKKISITNWCIFHYAKWVSKNVGIIFDKCINMYEHQNAKLPTTTS